MLGAAPLADMEAPPGVEPMALSPVEKLEEQNPKRPRLDDNTDPALEDEAILHALEAHTNPTPVTDHYAAEYEEPLSLPFFRACC